MIKRPKPSDTEEDILEMQRKFLEEKSKNVNLQPAAKLTKIDKPKKLSLFAQRKENSNKDQPSIASQTINEKSVGDLNALDGSGFIIGDIVEKTSAVSDSSLESTEWTTYEGGGFPKPKRIDKNIKLDPNAKISLFAQSQFKNSKPKAVNVEDIRMDTSSEVSDNAFGTKSNVIQSPQARSIHEENVEFLKKYGQEEILNKQQELLNSLDPSLVNFLKERGKKYRENISEVEEKRAKPTNPNAEPIVSLPNLDILKDENLQNWLHFDVIETEKMEWMRDMPATLPTLKPGESYEARFDWKGVLLPFTLKDENPSNDLHFHGDDSHRPGYTLQELFRLARSTMPQQRLSALGSVIGILSIYNQGYYDGILELPISKIFFLLRYAFDDNTLAMVEVTSKALSTMFYNQSDEVLLDITYDSLLNVIEPTLEIIAEPDDDTQSSRDQNFVKKFSSLNIKDKLLQTDFTEEENKMSSLNDFHLAETDLVNCLLRTNILQRISYIFTVLQPENSTKLNCVKILIRIARAGRSSMVSLVSQNELMKALIQQFSYIPVNAEIGTIRLHNSMKVLVLKLFRVICTYGADYIKHLQELGLDVILKQCIFIQENSITIETVKLQIEAYRCTRTIISNSKSDRFFEEIVPALQHALEWVYQFVNFEKSDHFLFRQCASSLIALWGCQHTIMQFSTDKLQLCFSKWFTAAMKCSSYEMSQITLLTACLNIIHIPDQFNNFLKDYFFKFLASRAYATICDSLCQTSSLLSTFTLRSEHKPLPSLNSVVLNSRNSPTFIISDKSIFYLIGSIVHFYNQNQNLTNLMGTEFWFNENIKNYMKKVAEDTKWLTHSSNWHLQRELVVIVNLLKSNVVQENSDKTILLKLSYKMVTCLNENQLDDILYLFSNFIFNLNYYESKIENAAIDDWKSLYAKVCVEDYLNMLYNQVNSIHSKYNYDKSPMLPTDWPCMMLFKMFKQPERFQASNLQERDVIRTTISFLSLQNINNLNVINPTEQFLYTMIAFLGKNRTFLEEDVNALLATFIRQTFASRSQTFDFDSDFDGKFNFENLFLLALDQFQFASCGDRAFSAMIMVPLAQKHNVKWRLRMWSEHVYVLRFITCREEDIIGSIDDYLYPLETNKMLLQSYIEALNSNILLLDSLPHKIAVHHLNEFKAKLKEKQVEK